MRAGLSAEYGLFASNAAHQLYPNPAAMCVVEDAPRLLAFLGRMLGKAMYENVLLELPLAGKSAGRGGGGGWPGMQDGSEGGGVPCMIR